MELPGRVELGASNRAYVKVFGSAEPIWILGKLVLLPLQWDKVAPRHTIQEPIIDHNTYFPLALLFT